MKIFGSNFQHMELIAYKQHSDHMIWIIVNLKLLNAYQLSVV